MTRAGPGWAGRARVALAALATCAVAAVPGAAETVDLVLTQVPISPGLEPAALDQGLVRAERGQGARIVRVTPGGAVRVLSAGFHSAADPEVSFDGRRIAFAAKRKAADPWCIWEMLADGSHAREITCGRGAGCRSPVYPSTLYTLTPTSTEPWTQVVFVGTEPGERDELGAAPLTSLYSCKLDGSALRRLTYNLSTDLDPHVLSDGRLIFAGRLLHSPGRGAQGRVGLLGVNLDGTDYHAFSGEAGRSVKQMPCATRDGRVVFVEADTFDGDGSGSLGAVRQRRPLHSYHKITSEADGLFHSPSPLPDGRVLVSWRAARGQESFGVWRLDPATGRREMAFDDPSWHDLQAKLLAPRPVPDGRSSVVRDDDAEGKLYALDVGLHDLDPEWLPAGTARSLRVLEGLPRTTGVAGVPPLAGRRFLGEIPLAEDGSFQVQIPANTPVQLQILDAEGLALRSSAWIWVRNHAAQGCVGCHEDPERAPPNRFVQALASPAPLLNLTPDARRSVDFRHDVMPILQARCVACHGERGSPPRLDVAAEEPSGPNRAYRDLLAAYVVPQEARRSRLIWHVLGRNTARPWDGDDRMKTAARMPPGPPALTSDERRTLVEWIDLGAAWDAGARGAR